jgi:hypothetical protein
MTLDEMLKQQGNVRRKPKNEEHKIQSAAFRWFHLQHPSMKHNLFAVPNASKRTARMGAYMKEEGLLPGVADVILLKSNRFYGACLFEFKTPKGRQSASQVEWQQKITNDGYKYVIVRSIDDFKREVTQYLSEL